jgi:CBS domain containing-hemolysin-like protein
MEFIRRILEFFSGSAMKRNGDMINFTYDLEDDNTQRVVTIHADANGFMIFTIFSTEEWQMIESISELSDRNVEDIVREISEDESLTTITIDPTEFE